MIALRLAIDTNILVSALKPHGLQRTVFLIAMAKPDHLYFSSKILAEYKAVLSRPEIRIRIRLRNQLLQLLQSQAHLVKASRRRKVASDPDDASFSILSPLTYFYADRFQSKHVSSAANCSTKSGCGI